MVNLETLLHYLPVWSAILFVYMIMCGLISTLDGNLCATASLWGHDFSLKKTEKESLLYSRLGMVALAAVAVAIANIPGMKVLYLFLFYGIFRASVLMPIVISLLSDRVQEKGVFWGVALAILIGVPIFGYGNFNGIVPLSIAGSLLTIAISGFSVWVTMKKKNDPA